MKDSLKYLALVTQVGVTVIVSVGLCTALGLYLDRLLETGPSLPCSFACWLLCRPLERLSTDCGHVDGELGAQVMFSEDDVLRTTTILTLLLTAGLLVYRVEIGLECSWAGS